MLTVAEIMKLKNYKRYSYIMFNKYEEETKDIPLEIIQSYKNELKVNDIYDDFGVVVEVKFNKTVWRIIK